MRAGAGCEVRHTSLPLRLARACAATVRHAGQQPLRSELRLARACARLLFTGVQRRATRRASPPPLTPAGDGYLALHQLVDVLPLLVIVVVFVVGAPSRRHCALTRSGAASDLDQATNLGAEQSRTHGRPGLNGIYSGTKENMMR